MSLLNPNIQAFLKIVETKSVSAAALALGLGQTAVTQRIRALESDLGFPLFIRSRQGMKPTVEGEVLLRHVVRVRELESQSLGQIRGLGINSLLEVRLAGPTSFISGRALPLCLDIFKAWPELNLQFNIDDRENRLDLLKQGLADIVVLSPHQVPLEVDSKLIPPDEYLLLASASWRERSLREILETERLFAFHERDMTSLNYLKEFDLLKYLRRPRLYVNENKALAMMLVNGIGFGLLSKEIAKPFLEKGQLIKLNQGRSLKDPLALAWYPRNPMPKYFKDIVKALK